MQEVMLLHVSQAPQASECAKHSEAQASQFLECSAQGDAAMDRSWAIKFTYEAGPGYLLAEKCRVCKVCMVTSWRLYALQRCTTCTVAIHAQGYGEIHDILLRAGHAFMNVLPRLLLCTNPSTQRNPRATQQHELVHAASPTAPQDSISQCDIADADTVRIRYHLKLRLLPHVNL